MKKIKKKICDAKGCENTDCNCSLSFFNFPKHNSELLAKWMESIEMKPNGHKSRHLCSDHFEERCFTSTLKRRLLRGAVPTIQSVIDLPIARFKNVATVRKVFDTLLSRPGFNGTSNPVVCKLTHPGNDCQSEKKVPLIEAIESTADISHPSYIEKSRENSEWKVKEIVHLGKQLKTGENKSDMKIPSSENSKKVLFKNGNSVSESAELLEPLEHGVQPSQYPHKPPECGSEPNVSPVQPSGNVLKLPRNMLSAVPDNENNVDPLVLKLPFNINEIQKPMKLTFLLDDQSTNARLIGISKASLNVFESKNVQQSKVLQGEKPVSQSAKVNDIVTSHMNLNDGKFRETEFLNTSQQENLVTPCASAKKISDSCAAQDYDPFNIPEVDVAVIESEAVRPVLKTASSVPRRPTMKRLCDLSDFSAEDMCSPKYAKIFFSLATSCIDYQKNIIKNLRSKTEKMRRKMFSLENQLLMARAKEKSARDMASEALMGMKRSSEKSNLLCKPEYIYMPSAYSSTNHAT